MLLNGFVFLIFEKEIAFINYIAEFIIPFFQFRKSDIIKNTRDFKIYQRKLRSTYYEQDNGENR
jgi:hypothetical protein